MPFTTWSWAGPGDRNRLSNVDGSARMDLRVAPSLAAARHCRHWIVLIARECGATPAATTAVELLVSEVVTNAVKYGALRDAVESGVVVAQTGV